MIQAHSGERSFTIAHRLGREPADRQPQLHRARDARAGRERHATARSAAAATTNIMMDGVSAMDTGSNGAPILQMNVESIAEVKVLTSSYQAEYGRSSGLQITAVTKSGTNRFRGSVYDVERNSDWNANSKTNMLNGDPKTVLEAARLGLLDRRAGRQAGRQQQAVLLLRAGVRAAHGRQRRRSVSACRRRSNARAISRRRTDNLGNPYPFIKDPNAGRRLLGRQPGRLLRGRRRARPDSGEPPVSARAEHPEAVAAAQHRRARPGRRTTSS